MDLFLKGGKLVDPGRGISDYFDLLIRDGLIHEIARPGTIRVSGQTRIIDLEGKHLVPGLIDMHVHLRDPGFPEKETIETGTQAAVSGGFTTIICMPNTNPVIDNTETIEYIQSKALNAPCNLLIMGSITRGLEGMICSPYGEMKKAGIVGLTDDGKSVRDSGVLYTAMEQAAELDLLISSHCEDPFFTFDRTINRGKVSASLGLQGVPALSEELMIQRDILLAEAAGVRLHIQHISTKKGVDMVRKAKARGVKVTAEAAPHHFTLTEDDVSIYGTNAKMSPPLRTREDVEAIREGLADNTIDVIADDHAPHTVLEKAEDLEKAPNGIIGMETTLAVSIHSLVETGYLSILKLIEKFTVNPAKILKISKGRLEKGMSADLTIVDFKKRWTIDSSKFKSKAVNTPFEGMDCKGKAVMTIYRGDIVYQEK